MSSGSTDSGGPGDLGNPGDFGDIPVSKLTGREGFQLGFVLGEHKEKLSSHEKRLDRADDRLDTIDRHLGEQDQRTEAHFSQMERAVSGIASSVNELASGVRQITVSSVRANKYVEKQTERNQSRGNFSKGVLPFASGIFIVAAGGFVTAISGFDLRERLIIIGGLGLAALAFCVFFLWYGGFGFGAHTESSDAGKDDGFSKDTA